jgi:DnaK suppressor protein
MTQSHHLDGAFIERQRERLRAMHAELLAETRATEVEETDLQDLSVEDAQEYEDDAQRLDLLDNDGALARRNMDRVRAVERALQKIEDGTYGYSDVSKNPIPKARLEVAPETATLPGE